MKIQTRMGVTSLVLIIGLLLSSAFLFFRFTTVYQLKQYQLDCVALSRSMSKFSDRNLTLFTDEYDPRTLSLYWTNDMIDFHKQSDKVFDSGQLRRLSQRYRNVINTRENQWDREYNESIEPLLGDLNEFTGSSLSEEGTDKGFYFLYQSKIAADDKASLRLLDSIRSHQKSLEDFLSIYDSSIEALIDMSEEEVSTYINESLILVAGSVLFILLLSLLVSARFSAQMVGRVEDTNRQVELLTEGSLNVSDDSDFQDEFDELVHHYHFFSRGLSERLNSLKILFQDIGNSISTDTNLESFQETIVELGIDSINADSGMLFLVDSEENKLNLVHRIGFCPPPFHLEKEVTMVRSNVEEYFEAHPLDSHVPVFGNIMNSGSPLFIKDNVESQHLPYNADPVEWIFISSFVCLPLIVGKRLMGMLVFYNTDKDKLFSDLDYTFIRAFSDYTAQSIDNVFKYQSLMENKEIQQEIDIAASIQKRLLPEIMPEFSIGSSAIHSKPARGISGDYFDAVRLSEDKVLFTVCDVAGKGVPASMLMIMIRTILHSICARHRNAHTLLKELNYHISGRIGVDQYATMAVFVLDEKKSEISYSNAAHHPLYLFRNQERQFRSFDTEGLPIGVDKNADFGHKRIKLNNGDYIFLFTDGLPEARSSDGDELSVEMLLKYLALNLEKKPEVLVPLVDKYINHFAQGAKQHDDQTFLALQIRA